MLERISWHSLGLPLVAHALGDREAPPVVLLHGFLDQGRSFLPVARLLADGYRVILPDHRGHGLSGHIGPGGYYHFPDYVLDLVALLDRLGLDEVALAGHSMGASIATYLAGAYPERVLALALLDGIGPSRGPETLAPVALRRWIHDVNLARDRDDGVMDDLDQVVARLARMAPRARDEVLREIAGYAAAPDPGGGLRWRFDPLHRTRGPIPFDEARFMAFLDAVACPTLLVWGEHTPLRPASADARAARLGDATSFVLAGAGHNLHHERPAELAAVLRGFLDEATVRV